MNKDLAEIQYLYTPGPAPIPAPVQQAMKAVPIHHRSEQFTSLYKSLQSGLQGLFLTQHPVLLIPGNGSGVFQTVLASLFNAGDKVIVINNGKFGKRWALVSEYLGFDLEEVIYPWGEYPSSTDDWVTNIAKLAPKGVILVHSETSTATVCDLESIAWTLRQQCPETIIVADTLTSVGIIPFYMDAWGIDVAVTTSQKALEAPAGAGFVAVSPNAIQHLKPSTGYNAFSLYSALEAHYKDEVMSTPTTQILMGVDASLTSIHQETLPIRWNRVHTRASHFRTELRNMGATLPSSQPADGLTAFSFPEINMSDLRKQLIHTGYLLEGGQDQWAGKILRVAHWNYYDLKRDEELLKIIDHLIHA